MKIPQHQALIENPLTSLPSSCIAFTVADARPPRKAGGASMWSRESQSLRLVRLRQAALAVMADRAPFSGLIHLSLTVYVGTRHTRRKGDLDAYIAGVCDGLMAATSITHLAALWADTALATIHPRRHLIFRDDSQVVSIRAEKIVGPNSMPWYEVRVEELRTEDSTITKD
jgi:hypothetical protein